MSVKIKISGLRWEEDVDIINEARPDYAGVMLCKRFWRCVDFEQARKLRRRLDDNIPLVGVFVNDKFSDVLVALRQGIVDMVQLQGTESEEYITSLQMMSYGKSVIKACQVHAPEVLPYAQRSAADHILLHCGDEAGEKRDWSAVKGFSRDFILAGGLTPENVTQAMESVRPWGVDLCGGVERQAGKEKTDRVKDRKKILEAMERIRAFQ
jgi:phosphoribosylanthranilate isomerase